MVSEFHGAGQTHPSTVSRSYPSTICRSYGAGGAGTDRHNIFLKLCALRASVVNTLLCSVARRPHGIVHIHGIEEVGIGAPLLTDLKPRFFHLIFFL